MRNKKQNNEFEDIYGLTPLQEGMLFDHLENSNSTAYVVQSIFDVKGFLDEQVLEKALNFLSKRHEVLRSAIIYEKLSEPVQVVLGFRRVDYNLIDLSHFQEERQRDELEEVIQNDLEKGYHFIRDSLIRLTLIKTGVEHYKMIWSFHHIIMDGWCMSLVFGDFFKYYNWIVEGRSEEDLLEEIQRERRSKGKYSDYVKWLGEQDQAEGLLYWERLLESYNEVAKIEGGECLSKAKEQMNRLQISLGKEKSQKLMAKAKESQVTINTVAESAWGVVLQKYNHTKDVVFGKVVSGRNAPIKGIEEMVGLFINTIPVRVRSEDETSVKALWCDVQSQANEGMNYHHCSLAEIQGVSRQGNELIQTLFVFENYYVDTARVNEGMNGLSVEMESGREQTNYDISISMYDSEVGLHAEVMYDPNKYGEGEMMRLLERLDQVLTQFSEDETMKVKDIILISEADKEKILKEFNDTAVEYPKDKTVVQVFEEQVAEKPNHIAVVFEKEEITYGELNEKANILANKLRILGVAPDDYVAIMAERSIEMIIGIYGIIKAGGAYVPIDPGYPTERIEYMIKDCDPKAILTYQAKIETETEVIDLADPKIYESILKENLPHVNKPSDLIYVIYTSGTTGKPKGVMVEHRNVLNLVEWQKTIGEYSEDTVILQNFNYIFDGSVAEIFPALLSGCTLEIILEATQYDSEKLLNLIPNKQIIMIPSLFKALVDYAEENRLAEQLHLFDKLYMGGEALPYDLIERYRNMPGSNNKNVFNLYGPTETVAYTTYYQSDQIHNRMLIGKPRGNTQAYILSDDKLCGIGMLGELCIAGDGLARGHLNLPDLTAEKFIVNPYGDSQTGNGRLYRTGDLARWLPDGNIEYLGRIDEQVKIRGFRIELGDIENSLRRIPSIHDAVVAVEEQANSKSLCGYFIADDMLDINMIKDELEQQLPDYMIPAYLMQVSEFPKSRSGKLDKKALPVPTIEVREETFVAPQTEIEITIADIFKEVLGIKTTIGIDDSFFSLDGDSIKAIRVAAKLKEAGFGIGVKEIIQYRTPRRIGKSIERMNTSNLAHCKVMKKVEDEARVAPSAFEKEKQASILDQINIFPLEQVENQYIASISQKFYLSKPSAHLIVDQFVLEGSFEEHDVIQALVRVIRKNGVLRCSYDKDAEQYVLYEHHIASTYRPSFFDFRTMSSSDKALLLESLSDHQKWSSYFTTGTWMSQFIVLRETNETYCIVFAIHHAIWDKMSSLVLEEQLQLELDGKEITSPLYAHYIASLNHEIIDEQVQRVNDSFVKLLEDYKEETKEKSILKMAASLIKLPITLYENYHQIDIWDFLSQIVRVIAQENGLLTEKTKGIPIQIVQEGRSKFTADYSQSLGLFIDHVPISICYEANSVQMPIADQIQHLDQLKKKNNLLWQDVVGRYSNDLDHVLAINYLGVYDVDFELIKQAIANNQDVASREIVITLHGDHLSIIYPVFSSASNRIEQKLQEKINDYQSFVKQQHQDDSAA